MFSCFKAPSDVVDDASFYPGVDDKVSVKNLRGSGQSAKAHRLPVAGVASQPTLEQKKRSWIKKLWSKMRTCLPLKKNKKASPTGTDPEFVYIPPVEPLSGSKEPRPSTDPGREVRYEQPGRTQPPAAPPRAPRSLLPQKGKPPAALPKPPRPLLLQKGKPPVPAPRLSKMPAASSASSAAFDANKPLPPEPPTAGDASPYAVVSLFEDSCESGADDLSHSLPATELSALEPEKETAALHYVIKDNSDLYQRKEGSEDLYRVPQKLIQNSLKENDAWMTSTHF